MFKSIAAGLGLVIAMHSAAYADVTTNKTLVRNMFDEVIAARDADKVDDYFTEDYIQHNPMSGSGRDPLKKLIGRMAQGVSANGSPITIHRIFGEGDLVVTHSTLLGLGPAPLAAFDVFRIEDGMIAEHWDNLMPLQEPNAAGRTLVDGATEITDLDKTSENKELVVELVEKLFIGGERLDITQYISPVTYLQHNPNAGDGLEGLQAFMQANAAQGIKMVYDQLHLVVAEGNFVLTGASGTVNDTPTAFYDLWRVEDGLIVEHWDIISPIPTENLPEGFPGQF